MQRQKQKSLSVVPRLPVNNQYNQSSTASDIVLNADNSPAYLQRSRWPSSNNPYSSAVVTTPNAGGRQVDHRKQFTSTAGVIDPLQAADIPIAHRAAMANRKIHTSHAGTGGGRRKQSNFRIK